MSMRISRRILFGQLFGSILQVRAQDPVFSADSRVVNLFATVHDAVGRLVPDLNREDFILSEEGNPVQIRYFSREADLPLTIGLLIDTSRSQFGVIERERRGAYAFLERVLRPDKDRAFVMQFDAGVKVLCPPTSSLPELRRALSAVDFSIRKNVRQRAGKEPKKSDIAGGTKLQTAVKAASDTIMQKIEGRKALLLLTDGNDEGSRTTLEEAIERAQRSDTLVYSILYPDMKGYKGKKKDSASGMPMPMVRGMRILGKLAGQTGGGFFTVTAERPLEQVLDRIQAELRTQYSIGFIPAAIGSGEYRKLALQITRNGLVVRSREGYYSR
jgi:VWFA-related protein